MEQIFWGRSDETPLGTVWTAVCDQGLLAVQIEGQEQNFVHKLVARYGMPLGHSEHQVALVIRQIKAYLQGERKNFEIPIHWEVMSSFQKKVLRAVYAIPYGERRTYGQIAVQIGAPLAARAVGRANATNPMPLVIPCHRLVGADGSLRGYGGGQGIKTKAWLLDLEKSHQ